MIRKTLNASRLQDEVSRRIHRLPEVHDDGVKIRVPRPQMQAPDAKGCNWTMKHFGNAQGFERLIASVLESVRAEYNLSDEAKGADRDPFASNSDPSDGPSNGPSNGPSDDPFAAFGKR